MPAVPRRILPIYKTYSYPETHSKHVFSFIGSVPKISLRSRRSLHFYAFYHFIVFLFFFSHSRYLENFYFRKSCRIFLEMKLWKTGWVTTFLVGQGSSTPTQQIVHCNNGDEPQMRIRVESYHFESVFDRKISDFELITRPVQAWGYQFGLFFAVLKKSSDFLVIFARKFF